MNRKGDICLACGKGRLRIAGTPGSSLGWGAEAQVYACSGCGHRVIEELG